jgi:F-type H+-transporting ATPase subunit b
LTVCDSCGITRRLARADRISTSLHQPAGSEFAGDDASMQPPDLSLLVVMAIFWAAYFGFRTFVFKPLGAILDEREKRTEAATAALSALLEKERETLADVDSRLTAARREAVAEREKLRAELGVGRQAVLDKAREDARTAVAQAQEKLEAAIAATRDELRTSSGDIARDIASQALGRRVA